MDLRTLTDKELFRHARTGSFTLEYGQAILHQLLARFDKPCDICHGEPRDKESYEAGYQDGFADALRKNKDD